jgi:hypothetical protein
MSIERVNELEREFEIVNHRIAHPFDLADHSLLKERRAAIVREAREIIRNINATEPDWCRTAS